MAAGAQAAQAVQTDVTIGARTMWAAEAAGAVEIAEAVVVAGA